MVDRCGEEGLVPLSQIANDYFDATAPRVTGPTSFAGGLRPLQPPAARTPPTVPPPRHGKLFNDPVHSAFRLGPACTDIIDSRQFQRLRRLKQLGLTYHVYPGACHNRFEHSLGVAHLAYRFARHIQTIQGDELDVEQRDLRIVELAGGCMCGGQRSVRPCETSRGALMWCPLYPVPRHHPYHISRHATSLPPHQPNPRPVP